MRYIEGMHIIPGCPSQTGREPAGSHTVTSYLALVFLANLPGLLALWLMLGHPFGSSLFQVGLALTLLQALGEAPIMARARHHQARGHR